MGGPGGVGEGHTPLAVGPAGSGQVVPPTTPEHRLQQPWTVPGGEASQGDSTHLHGIRSAGECESPPSFSLANVISSTESGP